MKRILIAGFIFCLTCQSLTATASVLPDNTYTRKPYIGAGAGAMLYRVGGNNYLGTGEGWPDDAYINNGASNEPYGFIAAGYSWQREENWFPSYSLGLRYMYASATTMSGYITQYSLPEFQNYNFSYDVQLLSLSAIAKADLYRWHNLMPYILVGAGIANYSTSNYSEQALSNVTPRVSPGFGGNSGNNFTYQFGIGIDYAIQENLLINLEYDYMNYGTVQTGKGVNYATLTGTNYDNESLKNNLTATALFLGLTYSIG